MKNLPLLLSLLTVLIFSQSANATAHKVKSPSIKAKIDGCMFEVKKGSKYSAQMNEASKVAMLTFYGSDVVDKDGNPHAQKLNVEYTLNNAGQAIIKGIVFEFNEQKFHSLPDAALLNISKIEWSKDKKSLVMSADFDCKVQKLQTSEAYEGIIGIQGSVENIKVNVSSDSDLAVISE